MLNLQAKEVDIEKIKVNITADFYWLKAFKYL
jgi:hypothetical protein